jgi:hypothetical protein
MIIKLKPKYKFQTAAILFHILQKTDSAKNFIFFKTYYDKIPVP